MEVVVVAAATALITAVITAAVTAFIVSVVCCNHALLVSIKKTDKLVEEKTKELAEHAKKLIRDAYLKE